jgi:hypothetical protein
MDDCGGVLLNIVRARRKPSIKNHHRVLHHRNEKVHKSSGLLTSVC